MDQKDSKTDSIIFLGACILLASGKYDNCTRSGRPGTVPVRMPVPDRDKARKAIADAWDLLQMVKEKQ